MSLTGLPITSAESGVAVLEQLQDQLPKVRYLALYRLPTLKSAWVFDFQNQSFLSSARQRAFKPQLGGTKQLDNFESQCTHYSEAVEYLLRTESALIACWSEKELTNTKLIEVTLRDFQAPIVALTPPERKKKPRTAAVEDPVEAFWEVLEAYEPVKRLSLRPYVLSQVVRHKEDGQLKVLKWLRHGHLRDYPVLAGLVAAEPGAYAQLETAQGQSILLRPFGEGISLRELLTKVRQFSPAQVQAVLARLLEGLQGLHARELAHGNLVPQNVLINREKQMHMLDPFLGEIHQSRLLTEEPGAWFSDARFFLAPEFTTSPPLPGLDIYALGVLAVYMLAGHTGFTQSLESVRQEELPEHLQKMAANLLESRYPEFFKLIDAMLAPLPQDRPATGVALRALFVKLTIH